MQSASLARTRCRAYRRPEYPRVVYLIVAETSFEQNTLAYDTGISVDLSPITAARRGNRGYLGTSES